MFLDTAKIVDSALQTSHLGAAILQGFLTHCGCIDGIGDLRDYLDGGERAKLSEAISAKISAGLPLTSNGDGIFSHGTMSMSSEDEDEVALRPAFILSAKLQLK